MPSNNCKIILVIALGILLVLKQSSGAETHQLHEFRVKAAFLYNFANFVEWPNSVFPNETSPIIIAVLGKNPLCEILNAAQLKPILARKVVTKQFESVENVTNCHILFVDNSEKDNFPKIFERIKDQSILTVSDTEGLAQSGVIINFVEIDQQLRFEINIQAAKQENLRISSKLLNLALRIYGLSSQEKK